MNNNYFDLDGALNSAGSDPALYSAVLKLSTSMSDMSLPDKCAGNDSATSSLPENMVLAMAYVPMQIYKDNCAPMDGFEIGTIFKELDKPFTAGDAR